MLKCLQQRLPLSGRPGDPASVGIEECKAVVDAMKKMQAGVALGQPAGGADNKMIEDASAAACPLGEEAAACPPWGV